MISDIMFYIAGGWLVFNVLWFFGLIMSKLLKKSDFFRFKKDIKKIFYMNFILSIACIVIGFLLI